MAFAQPTPLEVISRAQPGDVLLLAAPSIKDEKVALALAQAAHSGVIVSMVLDARAAFEPDAYTRHLSTVPGLIVRLAPRMKTSILIYRGIVLVGDGVWKPGGSVRAVRERGHAKWFSQVFLQARPYEYVPQPPPGYTIVEGNPLNEVADRALEAFEAVFESLYGGEKQ